MACYFGVCPNCPADFKTGAPNITIAGGAGRTTFSVAQTSYLMGEGAAVAIDGATYYVASKESTTVWFLVQANGAVAPNLGPVAVLTITHPFASISAAEAGIAALTGSADLTVLNTIMHIPCYCEHTVYTADNLPVVWNGWTTDATRYFSVYTITNLHTQGNYIHRNQDNGTWSDLHYRQVTTSQDQQDMANASQFHIRFEGLQMYDNSTTAADVRHFRLRSDADSTLRVSQCIGRLRVGTGIRNVYFVDNQYGDQEAWFHNNVFSLRGTGAVNHIAFYDDGTSVTQVYNNTVYGYYQAGENDGDMYLMNNVLLGCQVLSATVTFQDYNVYDFDHAEVHGLLTTQTVAELFEDASAADPGSWDWRPLWGGMAGTGNSDLIAAGVRLPSDYACDLDNLEGWRFIEWRQLCAKAAETGVDPT